MTLKEQITISMITRTISSDVKNIIHSHKNDFPYLNGSPYITVVFDTNDGSSKKLGISKEMYELTYKKIYN